MPDETRQRLHRKQLETYISKKFLTHGRSGKLCRRVSES